MNTIKAILPIFRIFQLIGLNLVSVNSTFKKIALRNFLKIYSWLHIIIRLIVFCFTLITNHFYIRNNDYKIVSSIDTVLICGVRLLEIAILFESLIKRNKEKEFFENLLEIDDILKNRFNVDLKYNNLRRFVCIQLIIWICIFVSGEACILYLARDNVAYFYFCLTYLIPFITSSLSYFQIIILVNLIKYRFHVMIKLISDMKHFEIDAFDWTQEKSSKNVFVSDFSGKFHENLNALHDTYFFDRLVIIRDLYHRLWNQTNLINIRFRCTMVCNIGNDFVSLLSNFYWMFMCLLKNEISLNVSVISCFLWSLINIFHIVMLCKKCHNTAENAKQIAHVTHCIEHVASNSKLSSFVSISKHMKICGTFS